MADYDEELYALGEAITPIISYLYLTALVEQYHIIYTSSIKCMAFREYWRGRQPMGPGITDEQIIPFFEKGRCVFKSTYHRSSNMLDDLQDAWRVYCQPTGEDVCHYLIHMFNVTKILKPQTLGNFYKHLNNALNMLPLQVDVQISNGEQFQEYIDADLKGLWIGPHPFMLILLNRRNHIGSITY